jgi:hypothetical protein
MGSETSDLLAFAALSGLGGAWWWFLGQGATLRERPGKPAWWSRGTTNTIMFVSFGLSGLFLFLALVAALNSAS